MSKMSTKIKIELLKKDVAQAGIARSLQISEAAVSQFISGKEKSAKFDEWMLSTLNIDMKRMRLKWKK